MITKIGKIVTISMYCVIAIGSGTSISLAAEASCKDSKCTIPVIQGAKCALSAYTNAADTWTMTISQAPGVEPFNTQEGTGEDNTPMKWTSGNAVFTAEGEYVYLAFSASNGGKLVEMHTGSGFAEGTSSAIMNGEDGGDQDFNDVIANVTCIK